MDKALEHNIARSEPLLAKVLNQSEQIKTKVEECAQELSSVNTILKEELVEHVSLDDIQEALTKSEKIEDKVQECAEDLHAVNAALADEITERKNLEKN